MTLARIGHFGRTAQVLGTSQPVVSARIASLERQLGVALVDRARRGFALTVEGAMVEASLRGVVEEMRALDARIGATDPRQSAGVVRIGAIDSVVSSWLPRVVERLHARLPNLRLELTVQGSTELVAALGQGALDLAFALVPAIGDGIRTWDVCRYEMTWVAAPRRLRGRAQLPVQALAQMPILTFPRGTPPFRLVSDYFHDDNVLAAQFISCNSLYAILSLAAQDYGIASVPAITVQDALAAGTLAEIPLEKPLAPMPLLASWQPGRAPRLMEAVCAITRREIADYCAVTRGLDAAAPAW